MPRVLIATLGFEEKFCSRAILRHGIREGDRVILITGELVEKVQRAYEWIRKLIQSSYGDSVAIDLIQLNPGDPVDSIERISKIIREISGSKIIMNLSGGMRSIIAYALLSCMMNLKENVIVEIEAEDLSGLITLDWRLLRLVKEGVSDDHKEVLKLIVSGSRDVRSLASKLGKDESTIRRQISSLKELGLVEITKRKPLLVEATELTRLLLGADS